MPDISDWDNEPGFDASTGNFRRLDLEEWLRKHEIVEKARQQGGQNQPLASQNHLDATEEQILAWINRRGRVCRENVGNYLSDREQDLTDMENDEELIALRNQVEEIERDGEFELSRKAQVDKGNLIGPVEEVSDCVKDFKDFRKRSGLTRLADYSHRTHATLAFIGICFGIEVVLNASLLMEVNVFGLLGAIAQMGLISAANILIAGLAMGSLLRQKNHVDRLRKAIAWTSVVMVSIGVFTFNMAVGHFRDSMQAAVKDPSADIMLTVGSDVRLRLQENLVGFESFQSLLLALMGILFFAIASWKWLQRDDPYPDYGRRDRELKQKRKDYSKAYNRAVNELRAVGETYIAKLTDIRHGLTAKQTRWREMCRQGERIAQDYPIQLGQYQHDLNYLLGKYREANLAARTEPAPNYFEKGAKVDAEILQSPPFKPPPQQTIKDFNNRVAAAIETLQKRRGELALTYPSVEAACSGA